MLWSKRALVAASALAALGLAGCEAGVDVEPGEGEIEGNVEVTEPDDAGT